VGKEKKENERKKRTEDGVSRARKKGFSEGNGLAKAKNAKEKRVNEKSVKGKGDA
jgi:hypothetical protein